MKVMVTGGAGYIGSHAIVELLAAGHVPCIVDNFSNASPSVIGAIARIAGEVAVHAIDVRDKRALRQTFSVVAPDAVLHFAALKAVGESSRTPLEYYDCNVGGLLSVLACMREQGVRDLVYSSTAAVYGNAAHCPVTEDAPIAPINPYARTKAMGESILFDVERAQPGFRAAVLRYFNPVGAHPSGQIGEAPSGVPNNLMPYVVQAAAGMLPPLRIFGVDYPTVDGSGVRDYLHVVDLARAHVLALDALQSRGCGFTANLGTGRGCSVFQLLAAFERATGVAVPHVVAARRSGDVAESYAHPGYAEHLLGWRAGLSVEQMCKDAWRWQQQAGSHG